MSRDACDLQARYTISNPTDAPLDATAVFHGTSTHDLKVTVDGSSIEVALDDGGSVRQRVALMVAPNATTKVVVTGTLTPRIQRVDGSFDWTAAPDTARHLVLAPDATSIARVQLDYVVAPLRRWGAAPKDITVTARGVVAAVGSARAAQVVEAGERIALQRQERRARCAWIDCDRARALRPSPRSRVSHVAVTD